MRTLGILWVMVVLLSPSAALAANKVVIVPLGGSKQTMNWLGDWAVDNEYKAGDVIRINGSSYMCKINHTASVSEYPPDSTCWELIAVAGETGPQGPQGPQGDQGPQGEQGEQGPVAGIDKQMIYNDNGTAAGAEVYYDKTTGNVGIGTSTSVSTLDIDGFMRLAIYSSPPAICDTSQEGSIVLTVNFTTCVCNGTSWVNMSDGTTRCAWTKVVEVTSAGGRVWMDRNLGASQVATSSTDTLAFGDLYQWGRGTDGHEKRTSSTTTTPSTSDTPGHSNFITLSPYFPYDPNSPYDWRTPQNDNLWQGLSGINNPCPAGFRLPTEAELNTEYLSWSSQDEMGAFESPLKLALAGYRRETDAALNFEGFQVFYMTSTISGEKSRSLVLCPICVNGMIDSDRSLGASVRCIKD